MHIIYLQFTYMTVIINEILHYLKHISVIDSAPKQVWYSSLNHVFCISDLPIFCEWKWFFGKVSDDLIDWDFQIFVSSRPPMNESTITFFNKLSVSYWSTIVCFVFPMSKLHLAIAIVCVKYKKDLALFHFRSFHLFQL